MSIEKLLIDAVRQAVREEMQEMLAERFIEPAPKRVDDRYISIRRAAEIAGVHECTIREWINNGSLKAYRPSRHWRLLREDLEARLTQTPAEPTQGKIGARIEAILAKRRINSDHMKKHDSKEGERRRGEE
jgi:excisionase family DNA binding protein